MLKIYLARHGQDMDNAGGILNGQRDKPLTQNGIKQALEIAKKIKKANLTFNKVYTSPLLRTRRTAKIITDSLNLENAEVFRDLIERDFGIMTGRPHTEIEKKCSPQILKTETVTYFLSPKGSETFPDLIKRGKRVLVKMLKRHKDGNILLVTHGDIGKMIYAAFYNLDWRKVLKMFHFGNSDLLLLSKDSPAEKSHVFQISQHNL